MNILSWNCRGIGNDATVRELHTLVRCFAPSILCLQETQVANTRAQNLSFTLGFQNCFAVSSGGRSGSLAMYWNNDLSMSLIHYS
ncbi:hypothetical protein BRADI_3g37042v3 [Brachypodium distachyon]|uniref:Endonuclease/exonuclease/phosphatase domain-containing protein n=1 Tax=Brachypodium distachyon TaxID=15368 RepID=A0A2K2D1P0_BRADI|nr:hypothetical protein BRADI_3g37042v3 [Brachypodium distachyon]